jgi:hypothetical protein
MRESLEKMLAKGVDNPLLRFGLGKAWLDEGNGAGGGAPGAVRGAGPEVLGGLEAAGEGVSVGW